jgi:hypothetical protein
VKKAFSLLFFCMALHACLYAQTEFFEKINTNDTARQAHAMSYLNVIASDSFEGRNTATGGQKKAAGYIVQLLESAGVEKICRDSSGQLTWFQQWPYAKRFGDSTWYYPYSENIVGLVSAAVPSDEYVVVSAHYDHLGIRKGEIYNGADDNGTGVSALLAMAGEIVSLREALKRNILIIFFSGEEKGLLGSKYYAQHPVVPMEKTYANINVDMIGRADSAHQKDTGYIYVIGSDRISSRLDSLLVSVNEKYHGLYLDYTYNDEKDPNKLYYRSDHYNFAKYGVPVIFFFSGLHPDYHRPTDDIEHIHPFYYGKRIKLILHTVLELQQLRGPLRQE